MKGWKTWAALAVMLSLAVGCGTRVSDERLRAASSLGDTDVTIEAGDGTASGPLDASSGVGTGDETATTVAIAGGATATSTATGGGGTGGGGNQTATSSQTARSGPATGSEVAIGVLGTFTGPVGFYVNDFARGVQLWGQWINNNGGLNGHRVKVIVGDDGGSPAGFNSQAQKMVEEQGVIAFAFTTVGLAPGGNNSYLDSKGVPTFGTEGGLNISYTNRNVPTAVPAGRTYAEAMLRGFAEVAKTKGVTKLATLACSDFGLCDNFDSVWNDPQVLREAGLQTVFRARPSLTTPDFTGICVDARRAGAQAIINGMDTASINRLADVCARQDYHPLIGLADLLGRPELADNPNADGAVVATKSAPWIDTRVPGIKQMHDALARYLPGVQINGTLMGGWLGAKFLEAAAANLPADNPTSKDIVDGLYKLENNDLLGMTYPLTFTPGQPSPNKVCWGSAVVQNKKFVPGPGAPLKCK